VDFLLLNTGPIGYLETSVRNYHYSLPDNSEERFDLIYYAFCKIHTKVHRPTGIEFVTETAWNKILYIYTFYDQYKCSTPSYAIKNTKL